MTSADLFAILIGVIVGIAAGIPMALLVVALTRAEMKREQDSPAPDIVYRRQFYVVDHTMLEDGKQ